MSSFEFTRERKPSKVVRIDLELVDFTISVSTEDGNCTTISEQTQVQNTFNRAREFNKMLDCSGGEATDHVNVEIKLDPVNSINAFVIPV